MGREFHFQEPEGWSLGKGGAPRGGRRAWARQGLSEGRQEGMDLLGAEEPAAWPHLWVCTSHSLMVLGQCWLLEL